MTKRRIVITGIGLVTPIGIGNGGKIFQKLVQGVNGVQKIPVERNLVPAGCNVSVAALVSEEELSQYEKVNEKEVSKFIHFALISSNLALSDAGITSLKDHYEPDRCGISLGNGGIGALTDVIGGYNNLQQSYKKLSPYFVPKILQNLAAGQVSIRHGLKGPIHCVTTACAAGAHSIGDAYNFIRLGYADCMLAGSSDCSIDPLAIAGFARMKALSSSTEPNASKPFDTDRNGFVIGEGAGILVLEELDCALKRKANIIAEVVGYGLSGDAFHTTSPSSDGVGAMNSMKMALKDAKISMNQINYINAHSTSTPKGDDIEINAVTNLLKQASSSSSPDSNNNDKKTSSLYVSSMKSSMGHLLGAAGSVETGLTAMSLKTGVIPQTLHLTKIDPLLQNDSLFSHVPERPILFSEGKKLNSNEEIDSVLQKGRSSEETDSDYNYALKNSFGFGGTNATLILKRYIE
jgi:3-oxoacyl-[acyl-carrier-protein] synthase II